MATQEEIYNENVLNEILDEALEKVRIELNIPQDKFVKYLKGFIQFKKE